MPQMSPLMWFSLYLYVLLLLMMMIIILYYFIIYKLDLVYDNLKFKLNSYKIKW